MTEAEAKPNVFGADESVIPDLLHPAPRSRIDVEAVTRALDLAFASGGTDSALDTCIDRSEGSTSSWDPACFERDIFLKDLIQKSFRIRAEGKTFTPSEKQLRTILAFPPVDLEVIAFRQALSLEVDRNESHRQALEKIYVELKNLSKSLAATPLEVPDIRKRQLSALTAAHHAIAIMRDSFGDASSSLRRLRAFGQRVAATDAFSKLGHLLEIEGNLAGLEVRVRVGHDGKMRSFQLSKITENTENPLYQSPTKRFFRKLSQWFRGYKFSDDEVLEELIDTVFTSIGDEMVKLFGILGDLEIVLAMHGFALSMRNRGLDVCMPEIVSPGKDLVQLADGARPKDRFFEKIFNPLLLDDQLVPTPCDLGLAPESEITIFTGPNSGGKTRLMQAIAIAQMLGQAGCFVPARKARILLSDNMFVSLIEDAKSNQREGRLGMELLRIREVFERLRPGGMVMLDELCSGTNPSEGEQIFELVTTLLLELEPQAFITTHFLDFADRLEKAHREDATDQAGMVFFQVELDASGEPTYQFVPGVATTSMAEKTARRLGVTSEELHSLILRNKRQPGTTRTARPALEESEKERLLLTRPSGFVPHAPIVRSRARR